MSAFSEIQDKVKRRVTGAGLNTNTQQYDDAIKAAINWAQREFCVVKWRFLQKTLSFHTTAARILYDLYDTALDYYDFGEMFEAIVIDGTDRTDLIRAQIEDIEGLGEAMTAGVPGFYAISGAISEVGTGTIGAPAIYIGMPTAGGAYLVRLRHYRRLPDLAGNADVSLICSAYNDDPLVEGAVYRFALDMSHPADPSLFYRAMAVAQSVLPYDGAPYPEKLQTKAPQK